MGGKTMSPVANRIANSPSRGGHLQHPQQQPGTNHPTPNPNNTNNNNPILAVNGSSIVTLKERLARLKGGE